MTLPLKASYVDSFEHAFDAKGRITIPAEWRDEGYESQLFVFPSSEGCLKVYPNSWLAEQQARRAELGMQDPLRRKFEALAQVAQKISWDSQGRVLVSETLRRHAGLKKGARFIGSFDHFEIWEPKRFMTKQPQPLMLEDLGL